MAFHFENLRVWKRAVELSGELNDLTRQFPKDELFGLTSQMKRAADSISLNIAEGSTGQSKPEFSRFLGFAIRSGIEVVGCLHLAKRKGLISEEDFRRFYDEVEQIIIMTQSLRNSL